MFIYSRASRESVFSIGGKYFQRKDADLLIPSLPPYSPPSTTRWSVCKSQIIINFQLRHISLSHSPPRCGGLTATRYFGPPIPVPTLYQNIIVIVIQYTACIHVPTCMWISQKNWVWLEWVSRLPAHYSNTK